MENELEIFGGDDGNIKSDDRSMGDFGELMDMLKRMPRLDKEIKHYSQYSNMKYYTGCTIMSAINAVSTITNIVFSDAEIAEVYQVAESLGWKPGYAWSRGNGLNAVRKWWNNKYPDNQFMTFVINLFTDEFYTVIEKLGILNISINVDSAYWKDARDNLIIDKDQYNQGIGHATTMMKLDDFICVDSIPAGTNLNNPMLYHWGTEEKIDGLNKNGNIRTDAHVIIFNNWLKQPEMDNEEKKRLESMAKSLTNAIQANKEIWELTNDQKEKEERNKQNNRNRAKLKIVESMLK